MKKIGIVTCYCTDNFGTQLQAYGLTILLRKIGFSAHMISLSHHPIIKNIVEALLFRCGIIKEISIRFLSEKKRIFTKKYLHVHYIDTTWPYFSKYKAFICGSDQIWAPNVYSPHYMLDFVPDEINKISYAPSIGLESIPDKLVDDYKKYVGRINHVSVREDKGCKLLKEKCEIESTVVLDPTLMIEKEEWDKIKTPPSIKAKYIFCYFLNKNHQYEKLVKEYAQENNYEIWGVSDNPSDIAWMNFLTHNRVGPCEFIGLIENAQVIFTDSYHGTIFSMLYHKDFVLFERFTKYDKICQNSRIEQLAKYFDINKNIVRSDSISHIELYPVNYNNFEKTLSSLRNYSLSFLKTAIN